MTKRRNHAPAFRARVALVALGGHKGMAELDAGYGVHQTLLNNRVRQLREGAAGISIGERG